MTSKAVEFWNCPQHGDYVAMNGRCSHCGRTRDEAFGGNAQLVQDAQANTSPGKRCADVPLRGWTATERRFNDDELCKLTGIWDVALWQFYRFRFDDGTEYRPDCVVVSILPKGIFHPNTMPPKGATVIEIKGGHVGKVAWSRIGLERFRRAVDVWGDLYTWHLMHWSGGEWVDLMKNRTVQK